MRYFVTADGGVGTAAADQETVVVEHGAKTAPSRRRLTRPSLLGAAFFLLVSVWLGLRLSAAWRDAVRREAYLPQIEQMARRSPDDGRLLTLLGARLMEAREHAGAATALDRAAAVGELNEAVWLSLTAATAASGDGPRALERLATGRRILPSSAGLRAAQERVAALGPAPDPGALAQAASPRGPDLLITRYGRGSSLNALFEWWGRRRPDASGYATRQQWALNAPDDAQAQRLWGLALQRNRREVEAEPVLRRSVELAPTSPAARLALADLLAGSELVGEAGYQYMTCLKLRRRWFPALMGLGRLSLRDHLRHAVPCFRQATEVNPESVEAWIGLGRAYLKTDRHVVEALSAFRAAARLAPERTDFYTDFADALEKNLLGAEAETVLRRRLAVAPADAEAHYRLAGVLAENEPTPAREAEAEVEAREALRLSPDSPAVEVQLGDLLLRRGDVKAALPYLKKAHAHNPYNVNTMNILARAYMRAGQVRIANDLVRRAGALFQVQQRISVLEAQRKQRPLDRKVSEELVGLYTRNGQRNRADVARDMVRQQRSDPRKAAEEVKNLNALIAAAGLDA